MADVKYIAKQAYEAQLSRCGFDSWDEANKRRSELIMRFIPNDLTGEECEELDRLQVLAELYIEWTCFDFYKSQDETLNKLERMLGHIPKTK